MKLAIADLFCGAGGTSTGAVQAAAALGYTPTLTAINHWTRAVETHSANHPEARHLCASLDSLNPRDLYRDGELDILWASPECTHHSRARGGKPLNDQSRSTAWCVTRWAEALRPTTILVENVPEFAQWGPIGADGQPLASRKGEVFRAWVGTLEALGYRVDWRELCAADYGDPTTRTRLFVQAVRGRRRIAWPNPTHSEHGGTDLFGATAPWRTAADAIDWTLASESVYDRRRALAPRTLERINEGLARFGGGDFLICMEHGGRVVSAARPVPTITTARGGAIGICQPRARQPFLVQYYGTSATAPVTAPLPTVTTHDRFALVQHTAEDVRFRMLQPHELAAAQGFPEGYAFSGTKQEVVKQIGNAVPCGLARAIVDAALRQEVRENVRRN